MRWVKVLLENKHLEGSVMGKIDKVESLRRRAAVNFARANVELSGFTVSQRVLDMMEQYIAGEINIDEVITERPADREEPPR